MTASLYSLPIFAPALQERQPVAGRLLTAALVRKALSNAYLLTGRAITDKWLIAQQLAAFLNCLGRKTDEYFSCLSNSLTASENRVKEPLAPSIPAAGKEGMPMLGSPGAEFCQNCRWIAQKEHPQAWLVLEGQGESGKIPVEKARQLCEEMNKTSQYMRVVVIPCSEQDCLHAASANALLKSIEEPHDNVLFMLFAASTEQVLPTIVSRCQVIPVVSRFKPGLWIPAGGADDGSAAKSTENLESLKTEFIHSARKRLSATSSLRNSYLKAVSESQDLSDWLRSLSDNEALEPELLIDLLLASELEVLREVSSQEPGISLYLSKLGELSEISKSQLDHYVRKSNVLETFAYSLTELRLEYLGD